MAFYKGLVPLRDVLAELYPASGLARTVVAEAGIREEIIDFDGAAIEFWKSILATAQNNHQVHHIINIARKHFPQNQLLVEAIEYYSVTPSEDLAYCDHPKERSGGITIAHSTVTAAGDIVGGDKISNILNDK